MQRLLKDAVFDPRTAAGYLLPAPRTGSAAARDLAPPPASYFAADSSRSACRPAARAAGWGERGEPVGRRTELGREIPGRTNATDVSVRWGKIPVPMPAASGTLGGMSDVTYLIDAAAAGDPDAASELLPLVHDEMRALAAARLAEEMP
jgi:hypothetical protein